MSTETLGCLVASEGGLKDEIWSDDFVGADRS